MSSEAKIPEPKHGGPEGKDPYAHDSKRRPSQDTQRLRYNGSKLNPSGGAQCRACAVSAGRCGERLETLSEAVGENRYCTAVPTGAFARAVGYSDPERCIHHQPDGKRND